MAVPKRGRSQTLSDANRTPSKILKSLEAIAVHDSPKEDTSRTSDSPKDHASTSAHGDSTKDKVPTPALSDGPKDGSSNNASSDSDDRQAPNKIFGQVAG